MRGNVVAWLKKTLPALGGVGIFCSSFFDSSFIPLPLVTDLFVMELSSLHPPRMPWYVAMAALGSLGGCVVIYWLARTGGKAYLKTQGYSLKSIQRFVERHAVACVFLAAVAPFPVPFKPFVIAQGVCQVPLVTFLLGTLAGRSVRFFIEGYLAVRYGEAAKEFVLHQKWYSLAAVAGLILAYFLIRLLPFFRRLRFSQTD